MRGCCCFCFGDCGLETSRFEDAVEGGIVKGVR